MLRIADWRSALGLYIFTTVLLAALSSALLPPGALTPWGEVTRVFGENLFPNPWDVVRTLGYFLPSVTGGSFPGAVFYFAMLVLITGQVYGFWMLVLNIARWAALRFAPDMVPAWLKPSTTTQSINPKRLRRFAWSTPVLMAVAVIVTCFFVTGMIARSNGYHISEFNPMVPAVIAAVLSVLGILSGVRFSSAARAVMGQDFGVQYLAFDHGLTTRVHELARKLNLPPPAVGVTGVSNAFAMGSKPENASVIIGLPLVQNFTKEELDAVIGHELGHVLSGDMRQMQYAVGFQRMFGAVFYTLASAGTQAAARSANSQSSASLAVALGNLLNIIGSKIIFFTSDLAVKRLSRSREFVADAVGAALTSPEAMANALKKIHDLPVTAGPAENQYGYFMMRGFRLGHLFATHPPVEQRLASLSTGRYRQYLGQ